MAQNQVNFQLIDRNTNKAIRETGGAINVCKSSGGVGSPDLQAIVDSAGASATNPVALVNGNCTFWIDVAVLEVDLFGFAPNGQFIQIETVKPGQIQEHYVDQQQKHQVTKIPYSHADTTATTEFDTGLDLPSNALVLGPGMGLGVFVIDLDVGETLDVGILASESGGDADGLQIQTLIAVAGSNIGVVGALITALIPHKGDVITGKSISYTTSTGTDTASGYITLPYILN